MTMISVNEPGIPLHCGRSTRSQSMRGQRRLTAIAYQTMLVALISFGVGCARPNVPCDFILVSADNALAIPISVNCRLIGSEERGDIAKTPRLESIVVQPYYPRVEDSQSDIGTRRRIYVGLSVNPADVHSDFARNILMKRLDAPESDPDKIRTSANPPSPLEPGVAYYIAPTSLRSDVYALVGDDGRMLVVFCAKTGPCYGWRSFESGIRVRVMFNLQPVGPVGSLRQLDEELRNLIFNITHNNE